MALSVAALSRSTPVPMPLPPIVRLPSRAVGDIYVHHPEVVGFRQAARFAMIPWWKKFAVTHPVVKTDSGEKNVIVLDIDEIGTTGTGTSNTAGAGASVSALHTVLMSTFAGLAFYGTYMSVGAFIDAHKELRELSTEKKERLAFQLEQMARARTRQSKRVAREHTDALLLETRHNWQRAHVDRVFMGSFGAVSATGVGLSVLFNPTMLGAVSGALAAAATPLMFASAPLVSVFGTGIAAYEGYRCTKTFITSRSTRRQMRLQALTPAQKQAYDLLLRRQVSVRWMSAAKTASYVGLAVGVPMCVFGGPYGLPLLLTSAAGMVAVGYLEGKLTGFQPQLTEEDKQALDARERVLHRIYAAHQKYLYVKERKHAKRRVYPRGGDSLFPYGFITRPVAALQRRYGDKAKHYPPARESVPQTIIGLAERNADLALLDRTWAEGLHAAFHRKHPVKSDWTESQRLRHREVRHQAKALGAAHEAAKYEVASMRDELRPNTSRSEATFALMRFLYMSRLSLPFAVKVMKHKELRKGLEKHSVITREGKEWHLDPNKLVHYFTRHHCKHSGFMFDETFLVAEQVLFTTGKNRFKWEQRQLLDMLAERVNVKNSRGKSK